MAQNQVTELAAEVLSDGAASVRTTEVGAEVLHAGGTTSVRATELAVEVLRTVADASIPGNASGDTVTVTTSLIAGAPAIDGNATGSTVTITTDIFTPIPGQTLTITASLALEGVPTTKPIDGGAIYEFYTSQVATKVYQSVDYDSIWGRGDRSASGLITDSGAYGWSAVFGPMADGFNNDYGVGLGDGPATSGDNHGAALWFETEDLIDIRGFQLGGGAQLQDYNGMWSMFGGIPGAIAPEPYTAGFDGFNNTQETLDSSVSFTYYKTEYTFEPRQYVQYRHWEFVYLAGTRTNARFSNEIWLKVAHSNLDGGDRRPSAAPERRVAFSMSSDWGSVAPDSSHDTPQQALFDGLWHGSTGKKIATIGAASNTDNPVSTAGAWFQFDFPRPVMPNHLLFVNFNNTKETYTGGLPDHYGTWHWEYADSSSGPWTSVGDPWFFRDQCMYMIAPQSGGFFLPGMPTDGAPHWRMVLDSGPAFGGRSLVQIQFDLFDTSGLAPPLVIAFSDDTDGVPATVTIGPPGDPYVVKFSDGSDDGFGTLTPTNTPNPLLTVAFTDEGQFDTWSDLYPSVVVQTVVVSTGR